MRSRAVRLNAVTRLIWRLHRTVYVMSAGRLGAHFLGWHVVLLKTVGRKTGQARTVALNALEEPGRYVVIASFVGENRHPAWFLNLQAKPRAEILERGRWRPVEASVIAGTERDRLWREIVARDPSYLEYQARTTRQIPLVVLEPVIGDN